eukprot:CAMPEP_0181217014 /NCGR_PEP_ID=MMETSP1096-20121128/26909_1 /TAXON_ID=156174 ORGANISM="Chrysochromulina ericina, Strain CCMP281" /NCGR_SAMPLE_ID=MMETSP1096 /ASSEMBLY_ACC=CAM_ASM_000453 /LENGTH=411 /DNA_ID=CAMNT_0023309085 /DNA_START=49 /DNA_END=1284 /DNA_ORIENTATION=+
MTTINGGERLRNVYEGHKLVVNEDGTIVDADYVRAQAALNKNPTEKILSEILDSVEQMKAQLGSSQQAWSASPAPPVPVKRGSRLKSIFDLVDTAASANKSANGSTDPGDPGAGAAAQRGEQQQAGEKASNSVGWGGIRSGGAGCATGGLPTTGGVPSEVAADEQESIRAERRAFELERAAIREERAAIAREREEARAALTGLRRDLAHARGDAGKQRGSALAMKLAMKKQLSVGPSASCLLDAKHVKAGHERSEVHHEAQDPRLASHHQPPPHHQPPHPQYTHSSSAAPPPAIVRPQTGMPSAAPAMIVGLPGLGGASLPMPSLVSRLSVPTASPLSTDAPDRTRSAAEVRRAAGISETLPSSASPEISGHVGSPGLEPPQPDPEAALDRVRHRRRVKKAGARGIEDLAA